MGWKLVNDRIRTARFKSCRSKTTIVQVYAPTEKAEEEEEKDDFYNSLHDTLNEIPKHDIKILMGDMNAEIGRNKYGFEQMIESFGSTSHTNNNGERFILFCSINGLCIGNSYSRHKMIHKYTWRSKRTPGDFLMVIREMRLIVFALVKDGVLPYKM